MEILGGHTETTNVVKQPLISVTGVGKMKKENLRTVSQIRPDQDIIVTKWIGLEATTILAKEKEEELSNVTTEDAAASAGANPGAFGNSSFWQGLKKKTNE